MRILRSASKLLLCTVIAVLAIIAFIFISFRLFGGDWDLHISQGYYLIRVHGGAVLMVGPHHVSIEPNIDGYRVYEKIIAGHVSKEGLHGREAAESIPGYFIVEMSIGALHQGLSDQEWLRMLREYGIKERPRLHTPSRYDHYLRRNVPES